MSPEIVSVIVLAIALIFNTISSAVATNRKDKEIARLKEQLKNAQKKDKVEVTYTVNDGRVPKFGKF